MLAQPWRELIKNSFLINEMKPPDPFRVAALNFYRDIARGFLK